MNLCRVPRATPTSPELQATIVLYLGGAAIIGTLLGLGFLAIKGGLRRLFR